MRGKSEDLPVGAPERRRVASAPSTTERELARESTLVSLCRRALGALLLIRSLGLLGCLAFLFSVRLRGDRRQRRKRRAQLPVALRDHGRVVHGRAWADLWSGRLAGCGARSAQGCRNRPDGSLDVVTLGNGGSITLGFAPSSIVDGPGPDFIVFENAFYVDGDPNTPYAELASVEVSDDGQHFEAFPCTATRCSLRQLRGLASGVRQPGREHDRSDGPSGRRWRRLRPGGSRRGAGPLRAHHRSRRLDRSEWHVRSRCGVDRERGLPMTGAPLFVSCCLRLRWAHAVRLASRPTTRAFP